MDMVYNQDSQSFDYYAFSDQDDFWLSEKLSCAIRAIQDSEATCCLYYSDVCNVDENLNGGINEFKVFAQVATSFCTLLTVNWASGCTMVFDRNLHQLLKTYHPEAYTRNHDAWINLIALSCGKVVPDLEHSYIKRRISEKNQVGEREFGKFDALRIQGAFNAFLHPTHYGTKCATELLNGYSELMSPAACKSAEQFIASKTSFACRIKVAFNKDYCFPYRIDRLAHIAKALLGLY
jgi:rhamnosyltransferase